MSSAEMTIKLRVDVDITSLLAAKLFILEMQAPPTFDSDYMAQVAMARMDCYINARAKAHLLALRVPRLQLSLKGIT